MRRILFLISALISAPLYAANVADDIKQELISDFSGGLNTADPSHKLATSYSPYMRNVFIDNGKVESVQGFKTLGSTPTLRKITGIFPFVRETGQTSFLVTDSSLTLETADFSNWTKVSTVTNSGAILTWLQIQNKMWGYNGVDSVRTWDGSVLVKLDGTLGTPNVPRFRFGAYYQNRVWGFNIPGGASDLYFSATVSTDNRILAPDDFLAWPAINATFVGKGDGQTGQALFVHQGLLRAGKTQSVYTVYGDNPSNYAPRKEETNVGIVSNESVQAVDGQAHYLGPTAIYRDANRISDAIQPDVDAMNRGVSSVLQNSWDSQTDFARGRFFSSGTFNSAYYETTATISGVLTLPSNQPRIMEISNSVPASNQNSLLVTPPLATPGYGVWRPTYTISPGFHGYVFGISFWAATQDSDINAHASPVLQIKNARTGKEELRTYASITGPSFAKYVSGLTDPFVFSAGMSSNTPVEFTGDDINQGFLLIAASASVFLDFNPYYIFSATEAGNSSLLFNLTPPVSGQFVSDVATLTSVTAWGNFDSANNTNGGVINYFYRSATSPVTIVPQQWKSIVPGVIIDTATSNNFVQWASTFVSPSTSTLPSIDNVTISHIEGQTSDARAVAIEWQNRYWLSVTTTSNSTQRMIYVKSLSTNKNPDAWMPIEGYPAPLAKVNNVLYGGSSSTGTVYRLDFGTNYDGAAFPRIYDTPDLPLNDYFFSKYVQKYLIDGEKSASGVMQVGTSTDEDDFSFSTFTIAGAGRYVRSIEGVTGYAKTRRLRLLNNELDVHFGVNSVNVIYKGEKGLSNK